MDETEHMSSSEILTKISKCDIQGNDTIKSHDDVEDTAKSAKASRKKKKLPNIRIFYGTFVHCASKGSFMIMDKWLLGVKNGKIVFSEPVQRYAEILEERKLKPFAEEITISLGKGTFMMPGFVDAHTDAVPLLALGIQDVCLVDEKMSHSRQQEKINLIHDDRIANQLFAKVIERGISCGTTTVAYDGTHIESVVRLFINALAHNKQRGYVSVDVCVPDKREDDHMIQLTKVEDVIRHANKQEMKRFGVHLMVSEPLPDWLEDRVATIHQDTQTTVKVSLSVPREGSMVHMEKKTSLQYHTEHGLVNQKSLALHCAECDVDDLKQLEKTGSGVIYCPAQDIKSGIFSNLRQLVGSGVKLGLGSNLKNSDSLSMLEAIRQCVHVAKQTCNDLSAKRKSLPNGHTDGLVEDMIFKDIDYRDFFYMATLGGAEVLGLSDQVGNFEVGKEFDALLVDPHVPNSSFLTIMHKDTSQDIVERFLFSGDDRNITAVYISGQRVK